MAPPRGIPGAAIGHSSGKWDRVGRLERSEGRFIECFVHLCHFAKLVVRLQAAWVGQEPKTGIGEELGLGADDGSGSNKGRPVRPKPKDDDAPGTQLLHLGLKPHRPFAEFGGTEFAGGGRHPPHHIRDAYAEPGQGVLLRW